MWLSTGNPSEQTRVALDCTKKRCIVSQRTERLPAEGDGREPSAVHTLQAPPEHRENHGNAGGQASVAGHVVTARVTSSVATHARPANLPSEVPPIASLLGPHHVEDSLVDGGLDEEVAGDWLRRSGLAA
jgi:hypothetical protein